MSAKRKICTTETFQIIVPPFRRSARLSLWLCCENVMASWIPVRGKQWPSTLFDNAGPETVLCTAIYFRPCRHRRLAKCILNSGLHSPHGVRPSLSPSTRYQPTMDLNIFLCNASISSSCFLVRGRLPRPNKIVGVRTALNNCRRPFIETCRFVRTYLNLLKHQTNYVRDACCFA